MKRRKKRSAQQKLKQLAHRRLAQKQPINYARPQV